MMIMKFARMVIVIPAIKPITVCNKSKEVEKAWLQYTITQLHNYLLHQCRQRTAMAKQRPHCQCL